ncbi:MAG: FliH/SctL family protein [Rhodospirillales bacterium]|nr:FliH/SctL family protein [Rhodospirillales bacterium]MDH3911659.1 FliH/SctL family protein [Rhodospirillales bacterium]MDH3916920.1 FliH/SctL family protein [Rhodospirillales bacterium]MDH3968384.1 FliH/SctL family protein [Rhodospirillales bacterium]
MARVQKFLFETTFDADCRDAAAAREKMPPPRFSEEDLAKARSEGFAAGQAAGGEEARRATDHAAAEALAALAGHFEAAAAQLAEANDNRVRRAIEIAVVVLRKVFPELSRRNALIETEALIGQCLAQLPDEPRVVIRVTDALLDPLNEQIAALAEKAGFEGKIVLLAEESLSASDVRVEWADGGAERDTDCLWAEIEQVLERALGTAPSDPAPRNEVPAAEASAPATESVPPEDARDADLASAVPT